MRIVTLVCEDCGTIIAGNVIEDRRVLKCPGRDCDHVIRFEDLSEADQEYLERNREKLKLD